jgi:hypothetical protein
MLLVVVSCTGTTDGANCCKNDSECCVDLRNYTANTASATDVRLLSDSDHLLGLQFMQLCCWPGFGTAQRVLLEARCFSCQLDTDGRIVVLAMHLFHCSAL